MMGISRIFHEDKASASAKLDIIKGSAEFSLKESDQWTAAIDGQSFLEGDELRTQPKSEISLDILEGTTLFFDAQSEVTFQTLQEKKGEKKLVLDISRGRIWGNVMGDEYAGKDSFFEIHTPQGVIDIDGAAFDIEVGISEVIVRVIKGSLMVQVKELDKEGTVEVGERRTLKLDIPAKEVILSHQGEGILDGLTEEFEESEWNLVHLEKFFPQEEAQIRRRIEMRAPSNLTNPLDLEVTEDMEPPVIASPVDGFRIPATGDTVTLEGTAPADAYQISVNGYTLTKFQPGDRKWSYFASRRFGTLVPGENLYSVVAITRDGKKSRPAEVTVFYDAVEETPAAEVVEEVSEAPVSEATENSFPAPVVLKPVRENPDESFVTTDAVLTIRDCERRY
ncbi:FecR domain-containing protein [Candidatus Gracilibacteria bacterium]|nr:FecR domain-containing protein [Candidatus Gracilibacteria bacterium]